VGVNTKTAPGAFDQLAEAKAAPDEPMFRLWGRDPLAELLVLDWAERRRRAARENPALDRESLRLELIQCSEAEEIAWEMRRFRLGERDGEAPAAVEERYSGATTSADELAAKERHDALVWGAQRLSNAIAEILAVAARIGPLGFSNAEMEITVAAQTLREQEAAIRPRRGYAHKAGG